MYYVDTHLHLTLDDSISEIVKKANDNNVKKLIISGCDKMGIKEALFIAEQYENIYLSIGFHPSEANTITQGDLLWLEKIASENKKVIAIGEIGLDYYWQKDNRDKQIKLFESCLNIAKKLNLPIVIHSRDAYLDTSRILEKYNLVTTIHCFSGSLEVAKEYIKRGYYLGIGGVVTFKNTNLKEVIKNIELENIVLETDSPYLAPNPYRGKINEPKYIPLIAEEVARIKNIDIIEIRDITTNNVHKIYEIL